MREVVADDDITIDLGKIGEKIKGMFTVKKTDEQSQETAEDDVSIDTKKVKDTVIDLFKPENNDAVDFSKVKSWAVTHKTLLLLGFVLLMQFVPNSHVFPCVAKLHCPWGATWMSLQASSMPVTKVWAENSVNTFFRNQISDQITKDYPNLPATRKSELIEEGFANFKKENKGVVEEQTKIAANQFRAQYEYEQDGKSYLYMPDIDPYNYVRLARNYLDHGYIGDTIKNGKQWDTHVIAPLGSTTDPHDLHPYVIAYWHSIISWFTGWPLMQSANYLPVFLMLFTFIPAFFLAKRYGGPVGGFFGVAMLGLHPAVVGRTLWGHADTDVYNIMFPIWLAFLFLAGFHEKNKKKRIALAALSGLVMGLYAIAWGGWWYIFDFMLATFGVYLAIRIGITLGVFAHLRSLWQSMTWPIVLVAVGVLLGAWAGKFVLVGSALVLLFVLACAYRIARGASLRNVWNDARIKNTVLFGLVLVITSGIFVSLLQGRTSGFLNAPFAPLGITTLKEAAAPNLWPNVYTTVAELNPISLKDAINQFGKLLLFISLLGVIGTVFLKDERGHRETGYAIFLVIWFFATLYATTKGVRFVMMVVPPFSIAFGIAVGMITTWGSKLAKQFFHVNKKITAPLLIFLFALSMSPTVGKSYGITRNDVPIMNDAWYNTLVSIQQNSQENAIITSWWDYGHHFKYVADRPVTFDGAWQNTPRAYWVGRLFLTSREREAVGILRMLDCGGNRAFEQVQQHINFTPESVALVSTIIQLDKAGAEDVLDQFSFNESAKQNILRYTHCNPPEGFVITSSDMIGKGGVWAHFGSWNFEKSDAWVNVRKMEREKAIAYLQEKYNMTEEKAIEGYNAVKSITSENDANGWIAPWPSFAGGPANCNTVNTTKIECDNGVSLEGDRAYVNTQQGRVAAKGVMYLDKTGKWVERDYAGGVDAGVAILPGENGKYQALVTNTPLHKSMFVKLFFGKAHGLRYFKPFKTEREITGGFIYTWKIDWEGKNATLLPEFVPHSVVEDGARVKLNYIGWADNKVFDASIPNWKTMNLTPDSPMGNTTSPLEFIYGKGGLIEGFNKGIKGMREGQEKVITIPPEQAYGTDPNAHPLGNKTLHFRVQIASLR